MRKTVLHWLPATVALAASMALTPPFAIATASGEARSAKLESSLKSFLQRYAATKPGGYDRETRYVAAFVDLGGDRAPSAIVYLTGPWCGSGGGTTLIRARSDSSFRIVTKVTITRPPIRLLRSTSHGWHNIAVWVRGGGVLKAYAAELRFDGATYPSNPSLPPARPLTGNPAGQVVISRSQDGKLLW
jgi:hypothetical protein